MGWKAAGVEWSMYEYWDVVVAVVGVRRKRKYGGRGIREMKVTFGTSSALNRSALWRFPCPRTRGWAALALNNGGRDEFFVSILNLIAQARIYFSYSPRYLLITSSLQTTLIFPASLPKAPGSTHLQAQTKMVNSPHTSLTIPSSSNLLSLISPSGHPRNRPPPHLGSPPLQLQKPPLLLQPLHQGIPLGTTPRH